MTLHADLCVKAVNIPETHATVELYIVDVGGNDVFREEWSGYMENANTFVFVYDVTSADSFKSAMKWIQKAHRIMKQSGHGIQGVLVANKADQTTRRVVTAKEGQEVARKAGITYFETSAATNTDVEAPFYFVAAAFYEQFMKRVDEIESTTKRNL
ncbi:Intraflagellar transport protein 27 [Gaertneriomyces sp. JEL0708]|nr:Intraflagellar transport protein 27 [Gaertneriomyces sp. JEL0708]